MSASDPPNSSPSRTANAGPLSIEELFAFFIPSVGEEKAREAVGAAITRLHFAHKNTLDRIEALAVLDEIATVQGIIGVAARFAKARIFASTVLTC